MGSSPPGDQKDDLLIAALQHCCRRRARGHPDRAAAPTALRRSPHGIPSPAGSSSIRQRAGALHLRRCRHALMPSTSRFNQMYALRYGTIPVVRLTGGWPTPCSVRWNESTSRPSGFHHQPATLHHDLAMLNYRESKTWRRMQAKGMAADFSGAPARDHEAAYHRAPFMKTDMMSVSRPRRHLAIERQALGTLDDIALMATIRPSSRIAFRTLLDWKLSASRRPDRGRSVHRHRRLPDEKNGGAGSGRLRTAAERREKIRRHDRT